MTLLDAIGTEKITDKLVSNENGSNGLMITLIIFLFVNVVAVIAKYFLDRALKRHEIKITKKVSITELAIKIEAELFIKLESLKRFQRSEAHQMLDEIIEIESFIDSSRLFICKKIIETTNESLDYYKRVVANFNEKDIKKEKEFTKKYSKQYYGE